MSKVTELLTSIRSRATSDTGTGGLFDSAGALITGWYSLLGPQEGTTFPYVVVFPVSQIRENVFSSTAFSDSITLQFSLFTEGIGDLTVDQAIVDRMLTRFDRWAPTVTGYAPSQLIHESASLVQEDNHIRHHALDFRCLLAKA